MSVAVDVRQPVVTETKVRRVDASGRDLRSVSAELRSSMEGARVCVCGAAHLNGLVAGCNAGEVVIEGDAGDYLGVLNDGATIRVQGNSGRFLADNMTQGTVIVEGNAGDGAAAYCYGGTVVVRGNAGNFTAVMNKGATVIVGGDVGDDVATYMLDGDVVIVGNAGKNLGNYLIRGSIYVGGKWESLGHNTRLEPLTESDRLKLRDYFERFGISADPSKFRKIVRLSEKPFYKAKAKG